MTKKVFIRFSPCRCRRRRQHHLPKVEERQGSQDSEERSVKKGEFRHEFDLKIELLNKLQVF
jgi:hypothetical protein